MHNFLLDNRDELIERCKGKVAQRVRRAATAGQLSRGVPMFLDQLTRTLLAEVDKDTERSIEISGASGGDASAISEIGLSAIRHGEDLLKLGYSVDQVVHDYGDLCQAITDLAFERNLLFTVHEFRTLNRCLDNAIAEAVTAFTLHHDAKMANEQQADEKLRLGFLVHELRNSIGTATLAVRALELGAMPIGGATGAILKRSLSALTSLINRSIREVSIHGRRDRQIFSVASFIADAELAARLDASLVNCELEVFAADRSSKISANRELLHAAVANLIQNAIKFTRPGTVVTLSASVVADRVLIAVADHCGGLPPAVASNLFVPFQKSFGKEGGLGLGLSIARQSVEADFGTLSVRNLPGKGCIFTIDLPLQAPD